MNDVSLIIKDSGNGFANAKHMDEADDSLQMLHRADIDTPDAYVSRHLCNQVGKELMKLKPGSLGVLRLTLNCSASQCDR